MSCHAQEVAFMGHKAVMIFCGEDPAPEPCATCAAPDAQWLCDWPMVKRVTVPISEMKVGDVWITQQAAKRAVVVQIDNLDINGRRTEASDFVSRRFWIAIPNHRDPYPYLRYEPDTAVTLRPGTCDAACCDAHAREVGEDVHYCFAHWNSWEAA
jgi:hypothetical protein